MLWGTVTNLISPIIPCRQPKGTRGHKKFQLRVRDFGASFLEFTHVTPDGADCKLLQFTGKHFPRFVSIVYSLQLLVILKKIGYILIWDIDVCSSTQPTMFFNVNLTSGEGMFVDLHQSATIVHSTYFRSQFLESITHVDWTWINTRAHFDLCPAKTGNEFAMYQSWFGIFQFMCHVSRESKVRILINCTGYQCRNIRPVSEDLWEWIRERGGCLDGHEMDLANIISIISLCWQPGADSFLKPKVALLVLMVIPRAILTTLW